MTMHVESRDELVQRQQEALRVLLGRIGAPLSREAKLNLIRAGWSGVKELLELRHVGLEVSEAAIADAFEILDAALGRMIDEELAVERLERAGVSKERSR